MLVICGHAIVLDHADIVARLGDDGCVGTDTCDFMPQVQR